MTYRFDCVVNHYRQSTHPEKVRTSAMLSASCLRAEPEVANIFLVDGSAEADAWLSAWCHDNDITYVHEGRSLSFAEGYNVGLQRCESAWTVLLASDIYVSTRFFSEMVSCLVSIPHDALGCAIPLLTVCDLPLQTGSPPAAGPKKMPLMTLNFNIFETAFLRKLGGVSEQYSGTYNDVDLALKIRKAKRDVYLLPLTVLHYGRMTTGAGSTVSFSKDAAVFKQEYPGLTLDGAFWGLRLRSFVSTWLPRLLLWPEALFPRKHRIDMQLFILSKFKLY